METETASHRITRNHKPADEYQRRKTVSLHQSDKVGKFKSHLTR